MLDGAGSAQRNFDAAKFAAKGDLVADALRDFLADGLRERMVEFRSKVGEPSSNEAERTEVFRNMINALRAQGDAISLAFIAAVVENFDPDAEQRAMHATVSISFEDLSLQKPESLDESIAMTNVGNRGELLYEHQMWELRQRMEWWQHERYPRVSEKSLAPYALCRAFFVGLRKAEVSPELHLPIFWQFDRYVLRKLHEIYEGLIEIFDEHGLQSLRMAGSTAPRPTTRVRVATAEGDAKAVSIGGMDTVPAGIDPQTWQMLGLMAQFPSVAPGHGHAQGSNQASGMAAMPGAVGGAAGSAPLFAYSDAHLAKDLAAVMSGQAVSGWEGAQTQDLTARASAIGRTFNQIVADPHLSRAVKPQFDNLRFAVLKAALADPQFFRNAQHPMRALLSELAQLAVSSRLANPAELERLGQMFAGLHQRYAVDAGDVAKAVREPQPLSNAELEQFLDRQIRDQKVRREALIEKSRKVVSEELWLQLAARNCSESLRETLSAGWEPMMALRLLRHGVSSKLWRRGIQILTRIVDAVDPPASLVMTADIKQALVEEYAAELNHVGLVASRVAALRAALAACFAEGSVVTPVVEAEVVLADHAIADLGDLLDEALVLEAWFEVYDTQRDTVRWMQARGRDVAAEQVIFSEFHSDDTLRLSVAAFVSGLKSGVTAAVNPTPKARAALEKLCA